MVSLPVIVGVIVVLYLLSAIKILPEYERGVMQADYLERFVAAREAVKRLPIRMDDRRGRKLSQIRLGARRARSEMPNVAFSTD